MDNINDQEISRNNAEKKREKERRKEIKRKIYIFGAIFFLWAGIFYGGYYFAVKHLEETKLHFSQQIEELKQENQRIEGEIVEMMELVHSELEVSSKDLVEIQAEINTIQEELELAGETLTGADETRESLQGQISSLDEQLADLQEQLEKLEEAARAF